MRVRFWSVRHSSVRVAPTGSRWEITVRPLEMSDSVRSWRQLSSPPRRATGWKMISTSSSSSTDLRSAISDRNASERIMVAVGAVVASDACAVCHEEQKNRKGRTRGAWERLVNSQSGNAGLLG